MPFPKGLTDSTSSSLLELAKARDPAAWRRLVDLYGPLVYSWCRRCGLGVEDSGDVIQEAFAAVASAIAEFRRERPGDTFRGWLRVIARNQIRLFYRRQRGRPRQVSSPALQEHLDLFPDPREDQVEIPPDDAEAGEVFRRALELIRSAFEERTWRAFWLTVVEEWTAADAAEELAMSRGAVRQAKHKVLRRLREELGDLLE